MIFHASGGSFDISECAALRTKAPRPCRSAEQLSGRCDRKIRMASQALGRRS